VTLGLQPFGLSFDGRACVCRYVIVWAAPARRRRGLWSGPQSASWQWRGYALADPQCGIKGALRRWEKKW